MEAQTDTEHARRQEGVDAVPRMGRPYPKDRQDIPRMKTAFCRWEKLPSIKPADGLGRPESTGSAQGTQEDKRHLGLEDQ